MIDNGNKTVGKYTDKVEKILPVLKGMNKKEIDCLMMELMDRIGEMYILS